MKRLVTATITVLFIVLLFRPVYMTETGCNWLLLWMCIGIPFGMRRMFLVLPRGYDLGGTVGMFVFGILLGGLIGGFICIWELLKGLGLTVALILKRRTIVFRLVTIKENDNDA